MTSGAGRTVVVISGGSRGLGMAIATRCLSEGYIVATYSRSASPFVKNQLELDPGRTNFFWSEVDATDSAGVKRFVSEVYERYGQIGAVVNNAGIGSEGIFASMRLCDIDLCVDLNLKGTLYLTWVCARFMIQRRGGCIINISSVTGIRGQPGYFESGMVDQLDDEAKARIIRRTPLGRLASVDDIAEVVLFMISPSASFITGQTIVVDGGLTC